MDPAAIVLIMAPILFPMAAALGVNAVHLGVLMAVNMEVGLCHPPVGLNLYVASGITGMGIAPNSPSRYCRGSPPCYDLSGDGDLHPGDLALAAASVGDAAADRRPSSEHPVADLWRLAGGDAKLRSNISNLSGKDPVVCRHRFASAPAARGRASLPVGLAAMELHHRAGAPAPASQRRHAPRRDPVSQRAISLTIDGKKAATLGDPLNSAYQPPATDTMPPAYEFSASPRERP